MTEIKVKETKAKANVKVKSRPIKNLGAHSSQCLSTSKSESSVDEDMMLYVTARCVMACYGVSLNFVAWGVIWHGEWYGMV